MKTIELVKCEDYLLKYSTEYSEIMASQHVLEDAINYARLLNQPLTLGMFVPCDEDGNFLEKPKTFKTVDSNGLPDVGWNEKELQEYYEALDRVIFEGFEVLYSGRKNIVIENEGRYCSLTFLKNGSVVPKEFQNEYGNYKTISDLCGYGLKIKVK